MPRLLNSVTGICNDTVEPASYDRAVTYVRPRLPAAALAVLVMLLLKRHYSLATADQLHWILAPTATLVSWFTSANLILERGVGYVDFANGIIVAPACAGVNFMIMVFGLATFCGLHHIQQQGNRLAWLTLAFSGAYCLTLMVNGIRIMLSMALYRADIYTGWLTVTQVHRMVGVGLYFGVLWLCFLGLQHVMEHYCRGSDHRRTRPSIHLTGWPVLGWYILIAVGLPLANGAWQQRLPSFVEHCATVVLFSFVFWTAAVVTKRLSKTFYRRVPFDKQTSRTGRGKLSFD